MNRFQAKHQSLNHLKDESHLAGTVDLIITKTSQNRMKNMKIALHVVNHRYILLQTPVSSKLKRWSLHTQSNTLQVTN